jgi:hypothetical protein
MKELTWKTNKVKQGIILKLSTVKQVMLINVHRIGMPSYIGFGCLWAESAVDSRGVAKVVMRENGTYWKLADVVQLWGKLVENSGVVRKGSVVDDQFGMCVALFLLNCWIAGCQVLLSRRLSSRLKLSTADSVHKQPKPI